MKTKPLINAPSQTSHSLDHTRYISVNSVDTRLLSATPVLSPLHDSGSLLRPVITAARYGETCRFEKRASQLKLLRVP